MADTHSKPHPATLSAVAAFGPDVILHAGDIGDLTVLDDLARIAAVHAVRGNIDSSAAANDNPDCVGVRSTPDEGVRRWIDLPDHLILEQSQTGGLRIAMVHIGLYGPILRREVESFARKERAHLVICGHSHVPFIGKSRGLTVFNPGSCGPRRFDLPIVFGTIEMTAAGLKLAHVDCETGNAWLPP